MESRPIESIHEIVQSTAGLWAGLGGVCHNRHTWRSPQFDLSESNAVVFIYFFVPFIHFLGTLER